MKTNIYSRSDTGEGTTGKTRGDSEPKNMLNRIMKRMWVRHGGTQNDRIVEQLSKRNLEKKAESRIMERMWVRHGRAQNDRNCSTTK